MGNKRRKPIIADKVIATSPIRDVVMFTAGEKIEPGDVVFLNPEDGKVYKRRKINEV